MTNPKTVESRGVAGRSKPAAAPAKAEPSTPDKSTKDTPVTDDRPADDRPLHDQNVVLAQLVSLTQSISALVQQNADSGDGQTNDSQERQRVVFGYDFLGVVLGRRAPSLFRLSTVDVDRDFGTLTFTNLRGATVARVRAANNTVKVLEGLRDGVAVTIDQDPNAIDDNQRIDSIVTFTSLGGVPVAIGPCKGAVGSIEVD